MSLECQKWIITHFYAYRCALEQIIFFSNILLIVPAEGTDYCQLIARGINTLFQVITKNPNQYQDSLLFSVNCTHWNIFYDRNSLIYWRLLDFIRWHIKVTQADGMKIERWIIFFIYVFHCDNSSLNQIYSRKYVKQICLSIAFPQNY